MNITDRITSESPPIKQSAAEPAIVLYDGGCGFCCRCVEWLIRRDRARRLEFAPLKSPIGEHMLRRAGLPPTYGKSLVLCDNGRFFTHSTGTVRIVAKLPWPWKILAAGWIIPRPVRDAMYSFVAWLRKYLPDFGGCVDLSRVQDSHAMRNQRAPIRTADEIK